MMKPIYRIWICIFVTLPGKIRKGLTLVSVCMRIGYKIVRQVNYTCAVDNFVTWSHFFWQPAFIRMQTYRFSRDLRLYTICFRFATKVKVTQWSSGLSQNIIRNFETASEGYALLGDVHCNEWLWSARVS